MKKGTVVWLTGISGSGKTTLAERLCEEYRKKDNSVAFLDGNIVRDFFEGDLGFTRMDRIINVKRIAFTASMLSKFTDVVIVANIAPYYEVRDFIRRKIERYTQIYVKASLDEVIRRDPRGHYSKYKRGELSELVGVDDDYDIPRSPDIVVDTDNETVEQSFQTIIEHITNI